MAACRPGAPRERLTPIATRMPTRVCSRRGCRWHAGRTGAAEGRVSKLRQHAVGEYDLRGRQGQRVLYRQLVGAELVGTGDRRGDAERAASPAYAGLFNAGLTLLDGSTSRDDWVEGQCKGRVPFDQKPQLTRNDFVQNSNDSYWATNTRAPLEGFSPLFGPEKTAQGPRTRIGLNMLLNPAAKGYAAVAPAGQDGKFNGQELLRSIWNDRSWYAEEFLPELRSRCDLVGAGLVNLSGGGTRKVDTVARCSRPGAASMIPTASVRTSSVCSSWTIAISSRRT